MKMENSAKDTWELRLHETAAGFVYPPTPDIASRITQSTTRQRITQPATVYRPIRLVAGALAVIILLIGLALAIPPVRAAVFEFFQIGAVGFLVGDEPEMAEPVSGPFLLDLAGATTLAEAANQVDFDLRLPAYPADLGPPDQVFLQELADPAAGDRVVILVWLDPSQPDKALLSLYQINLPFYGIKQASIEILQETSVADQPAFWVQGPHQIQLAGGDHQDWFFVDGNVLIWTEGDLTYRLESGLSIEEARRIAESLE
jgi:hypothetical protein